MRVRGIVVALALIVSGCAFSSEHPLFADSDAELLFGETQTLSWHDRSEREVFNMRFDRVGQAYNMNRVDEPDERPLQATFIPIADTPEQDYVAQVRLNSSSGAEGVAYAFIWREGDGYRVFADPMGFSAERQAPEGSAQFCSPMRQGECQFASRADVLGYYKQMIYPRFVHAHATPASYIDLGPPLAETAPAQGTK
jgi:hypothetical protein